MASKKNQQSTDENLDDPGFLEMPDDGTENLEADPEQESEEAEPAPESSEDEEPEQLRRVPRVPRVRRVKGRKSNPVQDGGSVTVKISQPKAPKQETRGPEGPPSLTDVLDGTVGSDINISRTATKGFTSKDCGFCGTFPNTLDTRRVIQQKFGGGTYKVDETGKAFELPGESLEIVEAQDSGFGFPRYPGEFGIDEDTELTEAQIKRDQRWWVYRFDLTRWLWTKPNCQPTCPPPNNGEPPVSFSYLNGPGAATPEAPSKTDKIEALLLEQKEERRGREALEQRRIERDEADRKERVEAERRRIEREDILRRDEGEKRERERREDAQRRETEERRRQDKDEALRREEWQKREADAKAEADRRRDELERRDRERREDFEKAEAARKADAERLERDRKDEREREAARRTEQRISDQKMWDVVLSSKKDGAAQMKEFSVMFAAMKDMMGLGEKSESSEKIELIRVGTEVVANTVLPALGDLISAWKHGRPPEQVELEPEPQIPMQPAPQQIPIQQVPQPQQQVAPVKELSTPQLLDVVSFVTESYKAGNSPRMVSVAMSGFLLGRGIPVLLVKQKLGELNADQLEGLLANALTLIPPGLPVRKVVEEARNTMATADAKVWFNNFAAIVGGRAQAPKPVQETPEEDDDSQDEGTT